MSDTEQNDTPLADINPVFKNAILDVKFSLYSNIILAPQLGTRSAHSMNLIDRYLNCLNKLYILSIQSQNGVNTINSDNLKGFPSKSKEKVIDALNAVTDCFKKNTNVADRIPYEDFILNSLKKYQFVLNENFED